MHEHDEARLVRYLQDVLHELPDPPTGDELLLLIEGLPAVLDYEAQQYVDAHRLTPMTRKEAAVYQLYLRDAAAWRRILADPALRETLLRIEDELLFGEK